MVPIKCSFTKIAGFRAGVLRGHTTRLVGSGVRVRKGGKCRDTLHGSFLLSTLKITIELI